MKQIGQGADFLNGSLKSVLEFRNDGPAGRRSQVFHLVRHQICHDEVLPRAVVQFSCNPTPLLVLRPQQGPGKPSHCFSRLAQFIDRSAEQENGNCDPQKEDL